MGALGKGGERGKQPADLALVGLVPEHRQPERRFRHEQVAAHGLERRRGRVARALVVAGDRRRARPCARSAPARCRGCARPGCSVTRVSPMVRGLPSVERLLDPSGARAQPQPHDRQRLRRRQHFVVPGPRMVRMPVRDDRALDRLAGVHDRSRRARSRARWASGRAIARMQSLRTRTSAEDLQL